MADTAADGNVNGDELSRYLQAHYQHSSQELNKLSTVSKMEIVRLEGDRIVIRSVDHYNLDMIISVGYRVNSVNATAFRR